MSKPKSFICECGKKFASKFSQVRHANNTCKKLIRGNFMWAFDCSHRNRYMVAKYAACLMCARLFLDEQDGSPRQQVNELNENSEQSPSVDHDQSMATIETPAKPPSGEQSILQSTLYLESTGDRGHRVMLFVLYYPDSVCENGKMVKVLWRKKDRRFQLQQRHLKVYRARHQFVEEDNFPAPGNSVLFRWSFYTRKQWTENNSPYSRAQREAIAIRMWWWCTFERIAGFAATAKTWEKSKTSKKWRRWFKYLEAHFLLGKLLNIFWFYSQSPFAPTFVMLLLKRIPKWLTYNYNWLLISERPLLSQLCLRTLKL